MHSVSEFVLALALHLKTMLFSLY